MLIDACFCCGRGYVALLANNVGLQPSWVVKTALCAMHQINRPHEMYRCRLAHDCGRCTSFEGALASQDGLAKRTLQRG